LVRRNRAGNFNPEVRVTSPVTMHTITLAQLLRWTDGIAASPDETLRKRRVRALLV
jgi:hypothetical protein